MYGPINFVTRAVDIKQSNMNHCNNLEKSNVTICRAIKFNHQLIVIVVPNVPNTGKVGLPKQ